MKLLLVALPFAMSAGCLQTWAAPLPTWAVGSWRGVAAVVDDINLQMGAEGTPAIAKMVQRTELTIKAHSFKASTNGEVSLIEGQRVNATLATLSAHHASAQPTHPVIVGESLSFSMTKPVAAAVLKVRGCREPVILGSQDTPALEPRCRQVYTILRFPDASHIAVVSNGGDEIVIFERN